MPAKKTRLVGYVNVNAGMIWIDDPSLFIPRSGEGLEQTPMGQRIGAWEAFLQNTERRRRPDRQGLLDYDTLGLAVMTAGDGEFPVYATFGEDGLVLKLTIKVR